MILKIMTLNSYIHISGVCAKVMKVSNDVMCPQFLM